jgi:hypothetical protein
MSTLVAQTISNGTVSTSSANVIQGSAKAWVNFNGNSTSIRASYNVSSITNNGAGDFTVNFTNALEDANYATQISSWYGADTSSSLVAAVGLRRGTSPTTTSVRVQTASSVWNNSSGTTVDGVYVTIFR